MRDMAGIDFPLARIFSQTVSGRPKGEVLNKLSAEHPAASELIFVEDKLSTLEKVRGLLEGIHQLIHTPLSCPVLFPACRAPLCRRPSLFPAPLTPLEGRQGPRAVQVEALPGGLGVQHA